MNIKIKSILKVFKCKFQNEFLFQKKNKLFLESFKKNIYEKNEKQEGNKRKYNFVSPKYISILDEHKIKKENKINDLLELSLLNLKDKINNKNILFLLLFLFLFYDIFIKNEPQNKKKDNILQLIEKKIQNFFNFLNFKTNNSINVANCCGIMGYIGERDASKILIEGIEILQNRGYDSCGITTINENNELKTTKYASTSTDNAIDKLKKNYLKNHQNHHIGIGHTRWATHGSKSDENAHPHLDYKERIGIVHNGIIENYKDLKNFLIKKNIPFKSDTDTEVVANLIGYYLDKNENFENAILSAIKQLEGTWGLCIIHKDNPNEIVLAANGSPLHIGLKENEIFVASEYSALSIYTNQYMSLKNGEILFINKNKIDKIKLLKKVETIPEVIIDKKPDPYKHWTIKEIYEQPFSLAKALNFGARSNYANNTIKLGGLDSKKDELKDIDNIILTGCGSSYYAALFGKYIMNYLNCFNTVQVIDSSDFNIYSIPKEKQGIVFISQSGETRDVIKACKIAYDLNIKNISIVNTVNSTIANMSQCGVYLNAGRENGVASTKSFTSEVVVLILTALWFHQNKKIITNNKINSLIESLHRLPFYAEMTLKSCDNICMNISKKLKNHKNLFVLGNGLSYPIALEGALKLKELTYIHSEGFTGSSLKHGSYALLDDKEKIPVIMLIFNDNTKNVMINTAEQIKSRNAYIICITDDPNLVNHIADDVILIPNNGLLTPLLAVIPLQLLSYYTSINKNINPDRPRCLAKTVTVS